MKNILLVEDDPFIVEIYANRLKKEGYKIDAAKDGQMALEKIKEGHPDLVILDLMIPKISGWELLKLVREDAALKDQKIIIVSNNRQEDDPHDIADYNVLKYFMKVETTPDDILAAVQEILG